MADRRRRRRVISSEDSEELSEGSDKEELAKNGSDIESEVEKPVGVESEYESAEEEEEEEEASEEDAERPVVVEDQQEIETTAAAELVDEEGGQEDTADVEIEGKLVEIEDESDEEDVEEERQEGDGEESVSSALQKEKVLDDDEDRRNPQYIPKKGSFYEHDDRVNVDPEEDKKEIKDKKKKKLWLDEGKWNHDMFREEEQAPKSSEELIAIYGYDIRNEDGPPRARRRRRYGRGPTKYTRNWQDEDAYAGRTKADGSDQAIVRGSSRGRGKPTRGHGRSGGVFGRMQEIGINRNSAYDDGKITVEENNNSQSVETTLHVSVEPLSLNANKATKELVESREIPLISSTEEFPALKSQEVPVPVPNDELNTVDTKLQLSTGARPTKPPFSKNGNISESTATTEKAEVVRTQTFENSRLNNSKPKKSPETVPSVESFRRGPMMRGRPMMNGRGRGRGRGYPLERRSSDFERHGNWTPSSMKKNSFQSGVSNVGSSPEDKLSIGMQKLTVKDNGNHKSYADNNQNLKKDGRIDINVPSGSHSSNHQRESPPSTRGGEHMLTSSASSFQTKRYSSLRQRTLPETSSYRNTQAPLHTPAYYEANYQPSMCGGSDVIPTQPQQQASSPSLVPTTHFQSYNTSAYHEPYAMRPTPTLPSPPRFYPPATLAAPQTVMPTPYISPNGNMVNYAPTPTGYAQYPAFQQFPPSSAAPPPLAPVNPTPQEVYQSGVTYYSTHNQPPSGRALPLKRPKAAIPIVPPPEQTGQRSEEKNGKPLESYTDKVSEKCSQGDDQEAISTTSTSTADSSTPQTCLVSIPTENLGKVES